MPALSATWTMKTIKITYRNPLTLVKESGSWVLETTGRITNTLSDGTKQVFRPGKINQGNLNIVDGVPSLQVDVPVIDDPDNTPQGGSVRLIVSFTNGGAETFTLYPVSSWPTVTDIGDLLDVAITPGVATYVIKGVPGGVAALNADGNVIDAAGNVITGGGGGTSMSTEAVQDIVGGMFLGGTNVNVSYDDPNNVITISITGTFNVAQMPPGMSYKLIWDDTNKKWLYATSSTIAITGRLNGRTDLFIDFIGGRETDRPSWGQLNGDTHEVTILS